MIERRARDGAMRSRAHYSPCETYRYGLERRWGEEKPCLFIMLNPSTATEIANDPTIERCERRAREMGFGGVLIANLFAYRATDPRALRRAEAPVGDENDLVLARYLRRAGLAIAGWGVHGAHLGRGPEVARRLPRLSHLGLTRDGHPRHPLYVPYAQAPTPWPRGDRYRRA